MSYYLHLHIDTQLMGKLHFRISSKIEILYITKINNDAEVAVSSYCFFFRINKSFIHN